MFFAKGNYFKPDQHKPSFTHLIYPIPEVGGLGIHATIDLAGNTRFGPDVEWLSSVDEEVDPVSFDYKVDEQRKGQPKLSSDIYAVGIIAIQALTGKFATDIEIDGNTGKVIWRNHVTVSDQLADILDKMVESYYKDRYPSAKEALAALKQIPISPTPSHHNPPPSHHSPECPTCGFRRVALHSRCPPLSGTLH
jgi:serine/threonine protein kinase